MNDFSKKLFWNIVFIFIILFTADFFIFFKEMPAVLKQNGISYILNFYKNFYTQIPDKSDIYNDYILGKNNFYREIVNKESKKKPILLFGCSFVYGHKISEDKIFSEVLGKYTDRPIYNRARHGFGVSEMLFQLQNEDFYKIIPQPEYIIYTFIGDHIRRMYLPSVVSFREYYNIQYQVKNNELTLKKIPKIKTVIGSKLKEYLYKNKLYLNDENKKKDLLLKQLLLSKKLVDKHWSGTKFIILIYLESSNIEEIIPELEQAGFRVVKRNDIAHFDDLDPLYCLGNGDAHPNEKAWDYIVPRLIKRLNIN